jgi:hypothetical protein
MEKGKSFLNNKKNSKNVSVYLKEVDYNFLMEELDKVNEEIRLSSLHGLGIYRFISLGQLIKGRALNYDHICECHKLDKKVI